MIRTLRRNRTWLPDPRRTCQRAKRAPKGAVQRRAEILGKVQSLGRDESDAVATRRRLLDPELMVPPSLWLVSEQAGDVTGTRFVAELRDSSLPPARAAEKARATAGWAVVATENLI
jgi:hypothetical protein